MVRINSTFKDRRIRAENVTVGDTIRWTEKYDDLTQSNVGIVALIHNNGTVREFYTGARELIGEYDIRTPSKAVITLLKPAPQNQEQPLESFQKLLDIAERNTIE